MRDRFHPASVGRVAVFVAAFASFSASLLPPASADPGLVFQLVVDPENPADDLPRDLVADVFLKANTRWPDGTAARPVDQKPDTGVRKAFSERILRRSVAAVRSYWQQRIFSGRDVPPPELESDEAVVRYVHEHRGAVGYVSATTNAAGTKVITVR